jgi:hypothetical protein
MKGSSAQVIYALLYDAKLGAGNKLKLFQMYLNFNEN